MKLLCVCCLLLVSAVCFTNCEKGHVDPFYRQFIFYAEYTKSGASAGVFKIDSASLPQEVIIPASQYTTNAVSCQTNRQCMVINNVKVKDELGNYTVDSIQLLTQQLVNDKWVKDTENKLTMSKTKSTDSVYTMTYNRNSTATTTLQLRFVLNTQLQ